MQRGGLKVRGEAKHLPPLMSSTLAKAEGESASV
jgi:hypothetical protein